LGFELRRMLTIPLAEFIVICNLPVTIATKNESVEECFSAAPTIEGDTSVLRNSKTFGNGACHLYSRIDCWIELHDQLRKNQLDPSEMQSELHQQLRVTNNIQKRIVVVTKALQKYPS
jgi:hypothetical protein